MIRTIFRSICHLWELHLFRGCVTYVLTAVIVVFHVFAVSVKAGVTSNYYKEYDMAKLCGGTINLDKDHNFAGQLRLRISRAPRRGDCSVQIIGFKTFNQIAFNLRKMADTSCILISQGDKYTGKNVNLNHTEARETLVKTCRPDEGSSTTSKEYWRVTDSRKSVFVSYIYHWFSSTPITIEFYTFHEGVCPHATLDCGNGQCVDRELKCYPNYLFGKCAEAAECISDDTSAETDDGVHLTESQLGGIVGGVLTMVLLIYFCRRSCRKSSDSNGSESSINENPAPSDRHSSYINSDSSDSSDWNDRNQQPERVPLQVLPTATLDSEAPPYATLQFTEPDVNRDDDTGTDVTGNSTVNNHTHGPESLPPPSYDDVVSRSDFYRVTDPSRENT